jgi:hypothetical protein
MSHKNILRKERDKYYEMQKPPDWATQVLLLHMVDELILYYYEFIIQVNTKLLERGLFLNWLY